MPRHPTVRNPRRNGHEPPRLTQLERNQLAEQRLLDAALQLVAEKGSDRMTLADVGELAGYSRSLPAHYFGSKVGLLKALIDHVHKLLFDQVRAMPKQPDGLPAVLAVVGIYLRPGRELSLAQRALYALRTEAMQAGSEIAERMTDFYRECENFVERQLRIGIERGEIHADVQPASQALVILGTLRGTVAQWLMNPDRVDLAVVRDEAIESLRRTLEAPSGKRAMHSPRKRSEA
jgi:AcrR family transcriptional regulator